MPSSILAATLIADPRRAPLTDARIDRAALALGGVERRRWLDEGTAADLVFTGDADEARAALTAHIAGEPIDVVVQPFAGREKKLLVADMDSTLIGQECVDELAAVVGLGPHVAAITERAMRGEIDFAPALRERVALLKGLPVGVIDDVLESRLELNPGALALAKTMRARGARVVIVSGGFRQFTSAVAALIGADEDRANTLEIADGALTGRVIEPIVGRDAKRAALVEIAADLGIPIAATLAVGDGANDLAMLAAAGLGVAYHAKPSVAVAAQARVDHGDLTALLYAQGIAREAFVEA